MDIVRDILSRVMTAFQNEGGFSDDVMLQIESQIRTEWGGDRPYIAKAGESEKQAISARNESILRDWRNGERVPFIARKYGISRSRVWDVLRETQVSTR